ncbi:MAG: mechanosensitive ion channel family protein [Clostridia bacterium]|nr:mechanosensitive ion channel family protein [Clostridia bacterium]
MLLNEGLTWGEELSEGIASQFGNGIAGIAMKIVAALVILIVGLLLVKLVLKIVKKGKAFAKLAPEVQTFTLSAIKVLGYVLVVLLAVATVGVPTASIIAVLGSCGLAVGLALQGSLANLAGGIMLLLFRPFHVGDYINDGGNEGTVKEITLFYTKIATADNLQVTLPNAALSNAAIKNFSVNDIRRLDIDVTLSPAADTEKVRELLLDCAKDNKLVLDDPKPEALVTVTDSGLPTFKLRTWFKSANYWDVYFSLNEAVRHTLDKNGLPLAHAQVDVHTDK